MVPTSRPVRCPAIRLRYPPVPCQRAQIGSTVLVHFGNRAAAGYIVDIAPELGDLQGNNALDLSRIKPVEAILSKPLFTAEAARIARWMSREYVATLPSACVCSAPG
ncbi:MAG: hypothetical protein ACLS3M_05070 [Collinsella sp.]